MCFQVGTSATQPVVNLVQLTRQDLLRVLWTTTTPSSTAVTVSRKLAQCQKVFSMLQRKLFWTTVPLSLTSQKPHPMVNIRTCKSRFFLLINPFLSDCRTNKDYLANGTAACSCWFKAAIGWHISKFELSLISTHQVSR